MLQAPLEERVWIYLPHRIGRIPLDDRWEIPWAPFFGTIGTAPHIEAISSLAPGAHGGNMDVPDVTVGNTIHLPVHHPGALFYTGDAHAAQGQGELCGVALEIAARGIFTFDVIKGKAIDWPRIVSPTAIMVVGSARPMEDAARIAYTELVKWLVADFGFDRSTPTNSSRKPAASTSATWSTPTTPSSPNARNDTCPGIRDLS